MQQRVAAVHALCPPPKHHCNGMKIARRKKQKDAFSSNIFPMLVTVQLRSFSTFWVLGLISQGREKRKVTNCQCLLPPMKVSSTVFVLCTSVHQDARKNPSQSTKFHHSIISHLALVMMVTMLPVSSGFCIMFLPTLPTPLGKCLLQSWLGAPSASISVILSAVHRCRAVGHKRGNLLSVCFHLKHSQLSNMHRSFSAFLFYVSLQLCYQSSLFGGMGGHLTTCSLPRNTCNLECPRCRMQTNHCLHQGWPGYTRVGPTCTSKGKRVPSLP